MSSTTHTHTSTQLAGFTQLPTRPLGEVRRTQRVPLRATTSTRTYMHGRHAPAPSFPCIHPAPAYRISSVRVSCFQLLMDSSTGTTYSGPHPRPPPPHLYGIGNGVAVNQVIVAMQPAAGRLLDERVVAKSFERTHPGTSLLSVLRCNLPTPHRVGGEESTIP